MEEGITGWTTGLKEQRDKQKRWSHISSKQVIEIHLTEIRPKQKNSMAEVHFTGPFTALEVCFVVSYPLFLYFPVSLILSLSLCVHIEIFFWRQESEILVVCLSPPHHGAPETKQARRVQTHTHTHTHTHTFRHHRGKQPGSVLHWKPHFPSFRQTGRRLGVTLNPFPHVSFLTRAPLLLSLLPVCCSLYLMPHVWR